MHPPPWAQVPPRIQMQVIIAAEANYVDLLNPASCFVTSDAIKVGSDI